VGIEVWVLVALVAILSAYLLPFLVGRREVMRRSNADDRYSSELRVLATGDALASDASDEDCDGGGRAQGLVSQLGVFGLQGRQLGLQVFQLRQRISLIGRLRGFQLFRQHFARQAVFRVLIHGSFRK